MTLVWRGTVFGFVLRCSVSPNPAVPSLPLSITPVTLLTQQYVGERGLQGGDGRDTPFILLPVENCTVPGEEEGKSKLNKYIMLQN